MNVIRAAALSDARQLAHICLLTGLRGGDATGVYSNDATLGDVFATPYLHGPSAFALVWDVDGLARGYVVGATDTRAFQHWFTGEWWPSCSPRHPVRTPGDEWLIPDAAYERRMIIPQLDAYPAHLHIDLLPDQQRQGVGRRLIEAACATARTAGARGMHLVADKANHAAQAFYPRVGFAAIDEGPQTVTFGRRLDG